MPSKEPDSRADVLCELENAAQPLVDFLYKYGHPHCIVLVAQDHVEMLEGVYGSPIKLRD